MKTILINLLILASVVVASTSAAADACARLNDYHLKYLTDSIERDFESFAWTTDVLGEQAELYFHEDGIVESIVETETSADIKFLQWNVKMVDGEAVLTIAASDGSSRSLLINPICEGFSASDAFGREAAIVMHAKEKADRRNLIKTQMAGVWNSVGGDNTRIRDMRWDLKPDATFSLAIAPDMYHDIHQGVWDISSDGRYLLLYFTNDGNPETAYTTEIVRVRSVDFEDLILDMQDLSIVVGNVRMKSAEKGFTKDFSM